MPSHTYTQQETDSESGKERAESLREKETDREQVSN